MPRVIVGISCGGSRFVFNSNLTEFPSGWCDGRREHKRLINTSPRTALPNRLLQQTSCQYYNNCYYDAHRRLMFLVLYFITISLPHLISHDDWWQRLSRHGGTETSFVHDYFDTRFNIIISVFFHYFAILSPSQCRIIVSAADKLRCVGVNSLVLLLFYLFLIVI